MSSKHNYKNLEVWKKARKLVKDVYVVTRKFPADERFGLTSQFRRAVVSISLNISEGSGRNTNKDFSHFIDIAFGSALEVENLIFLSYDLDFISQKVHDELVEKVTEIQRMLKGFQAQLNARSSLMKLVVIFMAIGFSY